MLTAEHGKPIKHYKNSNVYIEAGYKESRPSEPSEMTVTLSGYERGQKANVLL